MKQTGQIDLSHDVRKLKESLGVLPERVVCPAFIVVSGLPGTGKSFFVVGWQIRCRHVINKIIRAVNR